MKKVDYAYLAGFFDGEGSIGVYGSNYGVRVSITNTERLVLELCKFAFGGHVYYQKVKGAPKHWKPKFRWQINGYKACDALLTLVPYLKLKQEQAQIAIHYLQSRKRFNRYNPITEAELILRQAYARRINVKEVKSERNKG